MLTASQPIALLPSLGRGRKNEGSGRAYSTDRMPPPVTPEQIETYGRREPRPLHLDANVVAYFADLFHGITPTAGNLSGGGKTQSYTASARRRS